MNAERLLLLADKLDEVHALTPKQFNYNHWVGRDWQGKSDLSCGTQACALGWATTIPEFRALGLKLVGSSYSFQGHVELDTRDNSIPRNDFDAAVEVFNITSSQAYYLFAPEENKEADVDAAYVAHKIREFVASDGEIPEVEKDEDDEYNSGDIDE